MFAFIFTLILMFSLSFALYLMVRALPRIPEEPAFEQHGILDRWAHSEIPEKIDAVANNFFLKFLRKTRVFVLKLDNALGKGLQKMKVEDESKKPSIDFKEIAGRKEDGEVKN